MKLFELMNESKDESFETFAEKRLGGATKIEFQKEMGRLEVLGELIIKHK